MPAPRPVSRPARAWRRHARSQSSVAARPVLDRARTYLSAAALASQRAGASVGALFALRRACVRVGAAVLILVCGVAPAVVPASTAVAQQSSGVAWEKWQHQVGVVDVGARVDGTLVAMIAGHLSTVSPTTGAAAAFAQGPGGFSADPNAEPYFVVTPKLDRGPNRCGWSADDMYVLDLSSSPPGVARVDPSGQSTYFATLAGVDTLGGITLDTVGQFDYQLLVTGTHGGTQTTLFAVNCDGTSSVITSSAPLVEGGPAVAPASFGQFAGDLIASDENSGQVWAIDPTGSAFVVIVPPLPVGGDTGLESEGFVPSGFISSSTAYAYLADRGTADNPFPGTDSLLRLSAAELASAGVQDGDLLDAAEGGGTTVAIRCQTTCSVVATLQGTTIGHIEGHIAFTPQ